MYTFLFVPTLYLSEMDNEERWANESTKNIKLLSREESTELVLYI